MSGDECNSFNCCSWDYECFEYGWWYNWCYTYGCEGGTYEIDNGYCQENSNPPTCSEMNQTQCSNNSDCQWIEDIEWGNCGNYNSGWSCDNAHEDCFWDLCYGGSYGSWSHCCQGGSFQTPGIKQGCFVFGFFLDGTDEQVPIIMGVLGNNAKTIIGETSKEGGEDSTFGAKSGYDDLSDIGDDNVASEIARSSPCIESTDACNKDNAVDTLQEEENEKESPMECVKHGNSLTSMQTHMGNFQKKYQKLMSQLNNYGTAAAAKTSIGDPSQINSKIDELIDETSKLSAGSVSYTHLTLPTSDLV